MSTAAGLAFGLALGALHLLLLSRGVQVMLAGEGSANTRRRWAVLAGGRLLATAVLAVLAIRAWGLSPIGIGGGLVLAFFTWKLGAGWWLAAGGTSKENTA